MKIILTKEQLTQILERFSEGKMFDIEGSGCVCGVCGSNELKSPYEVITDFIDRNPKVVEIELNQTQINDQITQVNEFTEKWVGESDSDMSLFSE